jgi:SNF2 family DNA or RNA helicase
MTTHPAPRPLFTSKPASGFQPINIYKPVPQAAIDLVKRVDDDKFDPDAALRDTMFGAPDPFAYMDAAKANENIKALLEGAFGEEDEQLRIPKQRKKEPSSGIGLKNLEERLKALDVKEKSTSENNVDGEEDEDDSTVEGLAVKLLPHQVEGVAWMIEKEIGKNRKNGVRPRGGILADDMGLGKTIQSITLILTNPRPSKKEADKEKVKKNLIPEDCSMTTLVVAPLALIKQWESEIKSKVSESHGLRVLVHHGASRTKSSLELKKYDVVITTYQTLTSEHASSSDREDGVKIGCFGMYWYRVILDEAHSIKNRNAKSTLACYALKSWYRWCLTGTPMQNNLDELQSLIKFLQIKPYCELGHWKEQITGPMKHGRGGLAMRRLQYFLKACMKRRTKDILKNEGALSTGGEVKEGEPPNGFKIVDRKIETVVCKFDAHERDFYNRLADRAQRRLDEMMDGKKADYMGALVLLLRLRQACNHPTLMTATMNKDKDALTAGASSGSQTTKLNKIEENVDELAEMLGGLSVKAKLCDICQAKLTKDEVDAGVLRCEDCETDLADQEVIEGSKKSKQKKKAKQKVSKQRKVIMDSDDEDDDLAVPKSKQRHQDFGKAGDTDDENAEGGGEWLTSHNSETDSESEEQNRARKMKKGVININSSDTEEEDKEDSEEDKTSSSDYNSDLDSSHIFSRKGGPLRPSTKIIYLLDILEKETPSHKVIVFSQFTTMLDLIEPFLKKSGYKFTRYDGSMRNDFREASLERLRNDKRTRVLLCSLKCGSLGLNLTAASRVVILEPFWNPFVEEQAIDRVHRINQTRDVVVYRLTIHGTVEERILDLQEAKRKLAKAAIEGGKAKMNLDMKDILALFRRDAEHEEPHDPHGLGADRVRVLLDDMRAVSGGDFRVKATPRKEGDDPVFGRR